MLRTRLFSTDDNFLEEFETTQKKPRLLPSAEFKDYDPETNSLLTEIATHPDEENTHDLLVSLKEKNIDTQLWIDIFFLMQSEKNLNLVFEELKEKNADSLDVLCVSLSEEVLKPTPNSSALRFILKNNKIDAQFSSPDTISLLSLAICNNLNDLVIATINNYRIFDGTLEKLYWYSKKIFGGSHPMHLLLLTAYVNNSILQKIYLINEIQFIQDQQIDDLIELLLDNISSNPDLPQLKMKKIKLFLEEPQIFNQYQAGDWIKKFKLHGLLSANPETLSTHLHQYEITNMIYFRHLRRLFPLYCLIQSNMKSLYKYLHNEIWLLIFDLALHEELYKQQKLAMPKNSIFYKSMPVPHLQEKTPRRLDM